ncbi:unnamed protein product [Rhizophagus irregularis]|nr:unnamed protein product [Rhizophagus irregularis]CAB4403615.1 unnamed protein product [Rhizophagus irregularis]
MFDARLKAIDIKKRYSWQAVSRYDLIGQNEFYKKTEFRKASNNVASSSSSEDEQFFEASDSQSGSRMPSIEELENCNKLNATFGERINKLNEGTVPTKGIEKGVELEKEELNENNKRAVRCIITTRNRVCCSLCKRRNNCKQNYFELEGPTAGESVGNRSSDASFGSCGAIWME